MVAEEGVGGRRGEGDRRRQGGRREGARDGEREGEGTQEGMRGRLEEVVIEVVGKEEKQGQRAQEKEEGEVPLGKVPNDVERAGKRSRGDGEQEGEQRRTGVKKIAVAPQPPSVAVLDPTLMVLERLKPSDGDSGINERGLTDRGGGGRLATHPIPPAAAGVASGAAWQVVGECALMPRMLGSSWQLLNADHDRVYFQGMPEYEGQVSVCVRGGDGSVLLPGHAGPPGAGEQLLVRWRLQ